MNYFQQIKEKVLLQIKFLKTSDASLIPQINNVSEFQLTMMNPKIFIEGHPDNCITLAEIAFEELCSVLESMGVSNPKRLTVFEFYSKIRYFKKKKR